MGIWTPNTKDSDEFYKKFEEQQEQDNKIHGELINRINRRLQGKDAHDEIGWIIKSHEYVRLAGLFNDIKEFQTSYSIYITEKEAGVDNNIFEIVQTLDDFLNIKLTALYCFRRIELLCSEEDVRCLYDEISARGVSVFFMIQMLNEAKVHNKRFVGKRLEEIYKQYGREQDAQIIGSYTRKRYQDLPDPLPIEYTNGFRHYDGRKLCFITCVNNHRMYEECLFYVNRLIIPDGVEVEIKSIEGAESMTSGYNAGMHASSAEIKIYLHQDVCIINPFFIFNILDLFNENNNIAVIGMVGSPRLPQDAVMWHGFRIGKLYDENSKLDYKYDVDNPVSYEQVEAVDGLMIVTSKDIPWREDLFDGWDFYDASICAEARRLGLEVVVPEQTCPWVIHDDGMMNLYSYGKYRNRFINEYKCGSIQKKSKGEIESMSQIKEKIYELINSGEFDEAHRLITGNLKTEIQNLKGDAEYCVLAATACMQKEDYQRAFDIITIGLLADNKNYELYLTLGEYYSKTNLNQALLCFYQALLFCDIEKDRAVIESNIENVVLQGASIRQVSVVIVTKNQSECLKKCLNSIVTTILPDLYEIVVIDNASTDGTTDWLSDIEGITYCRFDEDQGYTKACNSGIKLCNAYNDIFLLDADTMLIDNTFFYLMLGLYSSESVGAIGGVTNEYINHQKMKIEAGNLEDAIKEATTVNCPMQDALEKMLYVSDHAILISRSAIDKVGIFDDRFSPNQYEDKDFCVRVNMAGMSVLLCMNSYIFKFMDRGLIYGDKKEVTDKNKEVFRSKWGCNIDYSTRARNELIEFIKADHNKPIEVLELGCSMGSTLSRIKRIWPNAGVHGVEYVDTVAHIAASMNDIIQGDVETMEIPYAPEQFDYIICADVLEHLRDPAGTIKRFLPYLKENGHFIISLPNVRHFSVCLGLTLLGEFNYADEGILDRTHLRFFTLRTAKEMIESTGLRVQEVHRNYNGHPEDNELITQLKNAMRVDDPDELKVYQYYFVASK